MVVEEEVVGEGSFTSVTLNYTRAAKVAPKTRCKSDSLVQLCPSCRGRGEVGLRMGKKARAVFPSHYTRANRTVFLVHGPDTSALTVSVVAFKDRARLLKLQSLRENCLF